MELPVRVMEAEKKRERKREREKGGRREEIYPQEKAGMTTTLPQWHLLVDQEACFLRIRVR